jgi:hypothetical protein
VHAHKQRAYRVKHACLLLETIVVQEFAGGHRFFVSLSGESI